MPKLHAQLKDIPEGYKIIACNDGSSDGTQTFLENFSKEMPIEIIQHQINRGLGETSRDLFEHANMISKPGDVIVRLDCDDTHEPTYIRT